MKSTHFSQLRRVHIQQIKDALQKRDWATKINLAEDTGLNLSTCTNILDELLLSGEVLEIGSQSTKSIPNSRRFVFNKDYSCVAAIYFQREGATETMGIVVSNLLGFPLHTDEIHSASLDLSVIEHHISELIFQFKNLSVIALGIPGVVYQGQVGSASLKALSHKDIESLIMEKYDLLAVAENDINCAAMGHYLRACSEYTKNYAYIYFSKSNLAGAGIFVNGQMVRGNSHFAGETSFLPLGFDHNAQRTIQNQPDAFSNFVGKIIASINAVVNPGQVVLSGQVFSLELVENVKSQLPSFIPKGHIPEVLYDHNFQSNYVKGLTAIALEKRKCTLQIVERPV